jgi:hypothetical protein
MNSDILRVFAAIAIALFGNVVCAGEQPISDAAESFVLKGVSVVLKNCAPLSKAKPCSHGKFLSERRKKGTSHWGDRISSQEVVYDGLEAVYRNNEVVQLRVTKPSWPMMFDLRVGTLGTKVRQTLGTPTRTDADSNYETLSYCKGEDCAEFYVDTPSGRVIAILWLFYYD